MQGCHVRKFARMPYLNQYEKQSHQQKTDCKEIRQNVEILYCDTVGVVVWKENESVVMVTQDRLTSDPQLQQRIWVNFSTVGCLRW